MFQNRIVHSFPHSTYITISAHAMWYLCLKEINTLLSIEVLEVKFTKIGKFAFQF